ncbi:Transmembrane protein 26 [Echinococcus granulosus]|uniref:Transmembrane protein 26 n=1 Tax=Echinococcus granulosus TaxID=6210 RepID=W6U822_ECHGR|nr:Transmembrane protein 26 [Echinococcus granulosus]EUB57383.1 Transmembrane protein 26 [Echinococcus granulosus]
MNRNETSPPSISASYLMDIPQSKTDDCLLDLTNSSDDLATPPKPPYPRRFTKNGLAQHQQQQRQHQYQQQQHLRKQSQQHPGDPPTSSSLQSLQPRPPFRDFTNCNSQSIASHKTSGTSRRPSGISFFGYKYSRAVIQDPSTGCCLRTFCRGWIGILQLLIAIRAILARFVFLALTLTLVVTVVSAKGENVYWLLCLLMLPLLVDLCYSIGLVVSPRRVQDKTEKWFTKCLLAYLFCACPPIWIIELHQLQQLNEATDAVINNQGFIKPGGLMSVRNPWLQAGLVYNEPGENLVIMGDTVENYLNAAAMRKNLTLDTSITHATFRVKRSSSEEGAIRFPTQEESLIQAVTLQHYPLKMRVRIMEQLLLLSVIVGRWLLPRFGISRDQLSQLLLINIGNAADILELFEAFNEEAVRTNTSLNICILCLWQASLLQFCFNKTATLEYNRVSGCEQLWFGTELWALFMSLILQDVPFLALRLTLVLHFNVRSYSNIFFTCKNSLLILLQVFRSVVISRFIGITATVGIDSVDPKVISMTILELLALTRTQSSVNISLSQCFQERQLIEYVVSMTYVRFIMDLDSGQYRGGATFF